MSLKKLTKKKEVPVGEKVPEKVLNVLLRTWVRVHGNLLPQYALRKEGTGIVKTM
jgi:hypothetical protein